MKRIKGNNRDYDNNFFNQIYPIYYQHVIRIKIIVRIIYTFLKKTKTSRFSAYIILVTHGNVD